MGSVPAAVEELLSESAHTRVARLRLPEGRSVIRKEPLGPDAEERVSHEREILRRLAGVACIAHLAPQQPDARSILLEDVHGVPLARVATPLGRSRLVRIMLDLARIVATVHQAGVVHRDINPGNILLAEDGRTPYLIDFALAMTFAELRPEFMPAQEIVGTLPYLAPEQTGRTGRSMDRRADLYGLGATMYELTTGAPPFGTGDPLRLVHDHLARAAVPPAAVNPALPAGLSDIIMHLLEKEPDSRYQSAEALSRDLERIRDGAQVLRVGQDDVPLRLSAPSRLVGREHEIEVLRGAFDEARAGGCPGLVISGESGVGKSALLEELRPIVASVDGWYAFGKFDRDRPDRDHDGVVRALRSLGRLLLAEPEDELVEVRHRLHRALGSNAGLAAAALPEFATLLKVPPDPGDPLTAQDRAQRTAAEILRAVASATKPVAFVVDDVQWAGATSTGLLERLLGGDEQIAGLLVAAALREGDGQDGHLLVALRERWRRQSGGLEHLRLTNLDQEELTTMVAEMLHAPDKAVGDLATPIFGLTGGNPYETVELLNGLRCDGVLWPTGAGWRWDRPTIERRLARENVTELMQARVAGLPEATRQILEAMACIGGEGRLNVLAVATGLAEPTLQRRLAPALEDGLLVMIAGGKGTRFHHDRLRDIVLNSIDAARLRDLRLSMARRLAPRPDLWEVAVEQYLPVVDALRDPTERRHVAALLGEAASQHVPMGESALAERMLSAAVRLSDDPAQLVELQTSRQSVLFRLGRLDEADEAYETIIRLSARPQDRVEATRIQMGSLTNRNRTEEALGLGLVLLRELGWALPTLTEPNIQIERDLDWCSRWIAETREADDLRRPEVTDPAVLGVERLVSRMMAAGFLRDQEATARLALAAARIWAERGPSNALIGSVGNLPWVLAGRRDDYRAGHRLLRRLLAVSDARGYEPGAAVVRFLYSLCMCHWFDPLEEEASYGRPARDGLVRAGDAQTAAYTFCSSVFEIDVASTVDGYADEVDAALSFAAHTGNTLVREIFSPYRWLVAALRGEPAPDHGTPMVQLAGIPAAAVNAHVARALAAAMLDDSDALAQHAEAAMALRWSVESMYPVWHAHLVRALALADRVRSASDHTAELAELDKTVAWIARRAADAPTNFRHMLSLVEAERAWAVGDFRDAIHSFDSALRGAGHRPWHRAYIAERSAKFMLAHGLDHSGWSLLVEAREAYRAWGARAKVAQLDRAFPSLDTPTEPSLGRVVRRSSITAGAIDMLAILEASRALSSETGVGALRARVVEVLSGMTSATDVRLLVWSGEQNRWLAATEDGDLAPLGERHRAPDSIIRYVERTREPLIVGDATRDDRFARDPYFRDLAACSVLAVPVLSRGALRAVLLLENRLIRDAFPVERLDAVMLIAGQLAVSLDNALIYSSMERKVAERTEQLALANERLAELSITDPLTGLANRRRLEESLRDEWRRAQRTREPVSLAMVDIDHFKQYNDRYGHREGDRCLQRVATQIRRNVRETDLVARYGGEEFAVVMPNTAASDAWDGAERIRLAISALAEPLTDETVVTVSVGVATVHDTDRQSIDQVLERADAALYQAKRAGRNRVHAASAD